MDLLDDVEVMCPHCGEMFAISVETAFPVSIFVEDCAVCCRPIQFVVRCAEGAVESVDTSPA